MQPPTDVLREQVDALADRIAGLPWAEECAGLDEVLAGAHDGTLLQLTERLGAVQRLLDATAARICGEVARRSASDAAEPLARRLGEKSAAALVARTASVPVGRAAGWCTVGVAITGRTALTGGFLPAARPAVGAALDDGTLALEAARIILDTLDTVAPNATHDDLAGLEGKLVGLAGEYPHSEFVQLCRQVPDVFDPDGAEPREEELRRLAGARTIKRRDGGYRTIIDHDPESAGFVLTALDALTAPRRTVTFLDPDEPALDPLFDDTRTLARRRLDAFVAMAKLSLKADDGDVSGTAATVLVLIDNEALQTGIGSATIAGVDTPISAATARRIACEARILPVVLGGASQPLDLGAGRRLFSEAQRLAMAVRDGGCRWPGCDEPPSRCEAAHVKPWECDGPTDIANGILFCRYHHRRYDNDGWTITTRDGKRHLVPPPWIDASRTPRLIEPPGLPRRRAG